MTITDKQKAILLLLNVGYENLPLDIFSVDDKDKLLGKNLIKKSNNYWDLTDAGKETLKDKIKIKYPLHVNGKIGDYNKIIKTMSEDAKNALLVSQMNYGFFDNIPVRTMRVFFQHLLDIGTVRKMGQQLITKWYNKLTQSMNYFKKNEDKTQNKGWRNP